MSRYNGLPISSVRYNRPPEVYQRQTDQPEVQVKKKGFWAKLWGGIKDVGSRIIGGVGQIGQNVLGGTVQRLTDKASSVLEKGLQKQVDRGAGAIDQYLNRTLDKIGK